MKWFYRILIFLFFIPFQTLLLEEIRIAGIKPDLALVLVYVFGWAYGEVGGLFWGLTLGGLMDLFSIGILGINFCLKAAVGLVAGMLGKSFLNLGFLVNTLIIFVISFLHDLIGMLFLHGVGGASLASIIQSDILVRGVYNSLVAIGFFFFFLKKINTKGSFEYARALFSPRRKSGLTE